jgi:hypothetical protein
METLSDETWAEICAAAARHNPPLSPDPQGRAEMLACLIGEYPNLAYDRERVAVTLRLWGPVLRHIEALAKLYQRVPVRPDDIMQERDLFYLDRLHRHALSQVLGCRALRRANRGKRDSRQEWLVSRLCGIWLIEFGAPDLGFTIPPLGGEPGGPLIDFLRAAMRQVMPTPPSPYTLRRAIERERDDREGAKQLRFYFATQNLMSD